MKKILFIHNKAMWYRIPFFNRLAKDYCIKFLFTDEKKVEGLEAEYKILGRYGVYPFSVAFGLIPIVIKEKYDVVVFPSMDSPGELIDNILCFVISLVRRKPYIVWSERWRCKNFKRPLFKRLYRSVDELIMSYICRYAGACATSGGIKQKEYFVSLGVQENKIFVVPYLSDIHAKKHDYTELEKKKRMIEKELGVTNKKVVLCVARLVKTKGIDYLIKAFAELKKERADVSLVIVGGEDYYGKEKFYGKELKRLCRDLNISSDVHFVGYVKSDNLPPYYLLCNLLVFSSIATAADTGALPISDAMYFGKPVISTDVVGFVYDLIKNRINGFMVPEKDSDAFFEAMKKIISDPELGKKMGEESKRMIEEEFTYEHMIEGFGNAVSYVLRATVK